MKHQSLILILALSAVLTMAGTAQNPADIITEKINQVQNQLPGEIAQHVIEGNITPEHIQGDLNASAEEMKKTATEKIQQSNITSEDLQKMAEEEIKNQVTQKVQQPGFEAVFAAAGILATACILRRRR